MFPDWVWIVMSYAVGACLTIELIRFGTRVRKDYRRQFLAVWLIVAIVWPVIIAWAVTTAYSKLKEEANNDDG